MGGNDRQWIDSLVTHSSFNACSVRVMRKTVPQWLFLTDIRAHSTLSSVRALSLSLSLSESLAMTSTCIAYYKSQWESLT